MMKFWGDMIRQLRMEARLSQRALAAKSEVDRSTVRRIEAGIARGDINVIESILNALGYELDIVSLESVREKRRREMEQLADPEKRSRLAMERLLNVRIPSLAA